jgi:hypothetical protein
LPLNYLSHCVNHSHPRRYYCGRCLRYLRTALQDDSCFLTCDHDLPSLRSQIKGVLTCDQDLPSLRLQIETHIPQCLPPSSLLLMAVNSLCLLPSGRSKIDKPHHQPKVHTSPWDTRKEPVNGGQTFRRRSRSIMFYRSSHISRNLQRIHRQDQHLFPPHNLLPLYLSTPPENQRPCGRIRLTIHTVQEHGIRTLSNWVASSGL